MSSSPRIVDLELAAIDFETTGLEPAEGHRVIEVAIIRGRRGEAPTRWSTLVRPGRTVESTDIHGLHDADLVAAPTYGQIASEVERQLDGAVLVAHNARFELAFLDLERRLCGAAPATSLGVLDTLALARVALRIERHGLGQVLAHLEIPHVRAHRAEDDALGTWHAAWAMLARIDPAGALTLDHACAVGQRVGSEGRAALARRLEAARGHMIWIEYAGEPLTRRAITPTHVNRQRVHAWCHLRQAERRFRLDRIRVVET